MRSDVPRRATPEDAPAMAAVANAWIDATPWAPRTRPPAEIARMIAEAMPDREMWVIGDPVAGYLSLDPVRDHVGGFYCARTGAGLGKALLDAAKAGRDGLSLNTHVPNAGARRFYRREGFAEIAAVAPTPPDTVAELRMRWRRPPPALRLRPAAPADAPACAAILQAWLDGAPWMPRLHTLAETEAFMRDTLLPASATTIAEGADGAVLGYLALDDAGCVRSLTVAHGARGDGVGASLIDAAKAARPQGLHLWCFQANTGAARFYAREGFVETNRTDGDNAEGLPDARLAWAAP